MPPPRKLGIPGAIGLEGRAIGVELVSINLDDKSALRPQEIDKVRAHSRIHPRCGNPMAPTEPKEHSLERAASRCLVHHVADVDASRARAVHRGLPLLSGQDPLQVSQGLCRLRDWDAVAPSHVACGERLRAMRHDLGIGRRVSRIGNGDMDRSSALRDEAPQLGGALMAEHRTRSACLNGRKPAPLPADRSVPDRVDAMVQAMEPPRLSATGDAGMSQAAGNEFISRQHTVIPPRKLRDPAIGRWRERPLSHVESRSSHAPNLAPSVPAIAAPAGVNSTHLAPR
jgi:hypothetical protein